ncbi:hypothetical protein ACS0TY_001510 [Phlomoides rotata]
MLGMPEFHLLIGVAVSSLSSSSRSTNLSGFTSHPVGNFVAEVNKEGNQFDFFYYFTVYAQLPLTRSITFNFDHFSGKNYRIF